jgi:hypothetical protein
LSPRRSAHRAPARADGPQQAIDMGGDRRGAQEPPLGADIEHAIQG